MPKTILILGGTGDAWALANALVETYPGARVITSLAGRTSSPRLPKGEVREGGFGGADGLCAYIKETAIDAMIDATHPYAAQISTHASAAAKASGIPFASFVRPPWDERPGDRWVRVADMGHAVREISRRSDACLITTGMKDLAAFAPIATTKLFVRLIEHPKEPLPLADAEIVIGKPPYKLSEERTLMQMLGIDLLVTKNAGGDATRAKIDAARELGIEVIMIDRPEAPTGDVVVSVDQVVDWLEQHLKF